VDELDKLHQEQQASLTVDMKKELAAMQKKILSDCVSIMSRTLSLRNN